MNKHIQTTVLDDLFASEPLMADAGKLMMLVLRTQNIGTWRVDVHTGKTYWSARVFEIHGLPPSDEAVDLDAAIRAYHQEDAKTVAWLIINAIENKIGFSFVLRLSRGDGSIRLVQSSASVTTDDKGEVTEIFGIFSDVTELCTSKDLAESRGRLVRAIVTNSPAPLIVLDTKMRYLEVNPAWVDYYNLPPPKALLGKHHYEVMPNLPERFRQDNQRALAGEIVHSHISYKDTHNGMTMQRGAVVFPWKTARKKVGGIIIMLTPPGQLHEQDRTMNQIARLVGQMDGDMAFIASQTEGLAKRRGMRW